MKPASEPAVDETAPDSDEPMVVHEYDGIIELDNRLPRWWLGLLFLSIATAFGYWLFFHTYEKGELPSKAYAARKAVETAREAERIKEAGVVTPEMLATLLRDPGTVEQGKQVYDQTCATCHDAGGRGKIAPNLTDDHWLHGGDPTAIYTTVRDGFLPKQMPAWGKALGEARVRAVTAYVMSIQGTHAAGGKAPQGAKSP